MRETTIVNLNIDQYDVRVDRKSIFGNPYTVALYGRTECIRLYRKYFYRRLETDPEFKAEVLGLRGRRLGCHCKTPENPNNPCHADIIKEYLDAYSFITEIMDRD